MNVRYIVLLSAISLIAAEACDINVEDGGDISYEDAANKEVTFPELETFYPEEDVPSQGKSPKRGICTNFRHRDASGTALMPSVLGDGVSWCYNWAHTPLDSGTWATLLDNGMTCYPMVWNAGFSQENIATFMAADPNSDYVLAYNEPNLKDQANMTPSQAAEAWPRFVAAAKSLGLKIVGP
ncbi:MAG TPA: hypothetical protein IAC09_06475, partial [Candidatus Cryptobacteroides intestinipullorum]|nr:hypothetical protein [Candidatus Cryptobacteroides intestinipullorum]